MFKDALKTVSIMRRKELNYFNKIFGGNIMDYNAKVVETVNENEMVWYKGMLMTRKEAKEMRENS